MPTNQQRRDAERKRLQSQLDERRAREDARKRTTLIASIVGTLVVIAAIIVVIAVATSGSGGGHKSEGDTVAAPGGASTVTFRGVTVGNATDLTKEPKVSSTGGSDPTGVVYKDLVVGTGKAATPSSTVSVQYTGVLYKDGKQFDSSWSRGGKPVQFPLTGVVPGFTQGIGGTSSVPAMKEGGRRVMIFPAALGYGAQASGPIPANSTLVFVVDLKSVDG